MCLPPLAHYPPVGLWVRYLHNPPPSDVPSQLSPFLTPLSDLLGMYLHFIYGISWHLKQRKSPIFLLHLVALAYFNRTSAHTHGGRLIRRNKDQFSTLSGPMRTCQDLRDEEGIPFWLLWLAKIYFYGRYCWNEQKVNVLKGQPTIVIFRKTKHICFSFQFVCIWAYRKHTRVQQCSKFCCYRFCG